MTALPPSGRDAATARLFSSRWVRFVAWTKGISLGHEVSLRTSKAKRKAARSNRWFAWASRYGFGFRVRWIEVQVYFYGVRGDR